MLKVTFEPTATSHILLWVKINIKTVAKIFQLIENAANTPFEGLSKPEPLKGNWKGYWSRRITQEHRLVYKVETQAIIIISAYGHY